MFAYRIVTDNRHSKLNTKHTESHKTDYRAHFPGCLRALLLRYVSINRYNHRCSVFKDSCQRSLPNQIFTQQKQDCMDG